MAFKKLYSKNSTDTLSIKWRISASWKRCSNLVKEITKLLLIAMDICSLVAKKPFLSSTLPIRVAWRKLPSSSSFQALAAEWNHSVFSSWPCSFCETSLTLQLRMLLKIPQIRVILKPHFWGEKIILSVPVILYFIFILYKGSNQNKHSKALIKTWL